MKTGERGGGVGGRVDKIACTLGDEGGGGVADVDGTHRFVGVEKGDDGTDFFEGEAKGDDGTDCFVGEEKGDDDMAKL